MQTNPFVTIEMMFHYADLLREIPNVEERGINEFWTNFVLTLEFKNKYGNK